MSQGNVTLTGYNKAGEEVCCETCNEMDAADVQAEMLVDDDVVRVECTEE